MRFFRSSSTISGRAVRAQNAKVKIEESDRAPWTRASPKPAKRRQIAMPFTRADLDRLRNLPFCTLHFDFWLLHSMNETSKLKVDHLKAGYDGKVVLEDVSMEV